MMYEYRTIKKVQRGGKIVLILYYELVSGRYVVRYERRRILETTNLQEARFVYELKKGELNDPAQ